MLLDSPCRPTIALRDKEVARASYGDTLGLPLEEENPVGATFRGGGGTFLDGRWRGPARSQPGGLVQGPGRQHVCSSRAGLAGRRPNPSALGFTHFTG
jgi:hypothetical protein